MPPVTAALNYLKNTTIRRTTGGSPRWRRRRNALLLAGGAAALLPCLILIMIAGLVLSLMAPLSDDAEASVDCALPGDISLAGAASGALSQFNDEQLGNASIIIATGRKLNVPVYGQVIAVATAIQESSLINVDHGDVVGPDSRGLFQQRAAWGPLEKRMDPEWATTYFFTGGEGGQRGLLDVPNWQNLPLGVAAQAVQVSADSTGRWYAQHEPTARALVAELGDGEYVPQSCGPDPMMSCPASPYTDIESELMPDAQLVLRCLYQAFPEITTYHGVGQRPSGGDGDHAAGRALDAMIANYDTPAGNEYGWKAARWLQKRHTQLGIKYLIFDAKIWSVERADEGWRDYEHYSGCTSDTCMHLDHVHVSVYGNAARSTGGSGDWTLPVEAGTYRLTARFGQCNGPWSNCHTGLDFAAAAGTPVHAAADGVVSFAGGAGPYGNLIRIDHGDGVVTAYAHLSSFAGGIDGAQVDAGTVIGYVGSTGNSSGPHLHFEVRTGTEFQDPEVWLPDHGVDP